MSESMYYLEMCELDAARAEVLLESFESCSILEEGAAELRTYVEDGFDRFDEDASKATAEKKKNLVARAWDAIIKLIRGVKDKIFNSIGKIDDNTIAVVPAQYVDKKNMSALDKVIAKLKGITATTPAKVVMTIVYAVTATLALFSIIKGTKKIAMTWKEAKANAAFYKKCNETAAALAETGKKIQEKNIDASFAATIADRKTPDRKDGKMTWDDHVFNAYRESVGDLGSTLKNVGTALVPAFQEAQQEQKKSGGKIKFPRVDGEIVYSPGAQAMYDKAAAMAKNVLPKGGDTPRLGTINTPSTKVNTAKLDVGTDSYRPSTRVRLPRLTISAAG